MKLSRKNISVSASAIFLLAIVVLAIPVLIKNSLTLDAPTISFNKSSNVLSWNSVSHADYYIVKICGTDRGTVEVEIANTSYNCGAYINKNKSRDYQFYVKAVSNNSYYSESKWSRGIYYSLFAI